jgi:superfamily I DNA/RNA helicase
MGWWIEENKLTQRQLQIINSTLNVKDGTIWIKGFAGTGKTLVLLHIMEKITALNPGAKACFITFTNSLTDMVKSSPLFSQNSSKYGINNHTKFLNNNRKFDYVFIDEIQDLKTEDLFRIKRLANQVFMSGDFDQNIYDDTCTIDDLNRCFGNIVDYELNQVMRITKNVCKLAKYIYPNANIVEGMEAAKKNASINIGEANNRNDEFYWVLKNASARTLVGRPTAILFHTHREIEVFGMEFL